MKFRIVKNKWGCYEIERKYKRLPFWVSIEFYMYSQYEMALQNLQIIKENRKAKRVIVYEEDVDFNGEMEAGDTK